MEGSEVIQKQLEVLKTVLMRLELLGTGFIKETRWSVDITIDFNKLRLSSNQRNWLNGICQATDQKKKKKKQDYSKKKILGRHWYSSPKHKMTQTQFLKISFLGGNFLKNWDFHVSPVFNCRLVESRRKHWKASQNYFWSYKSKVKPKTHTRQ